MDLDQAKMNEIVSSIADRYAKEIYNGINYTGKNSFVISDNELTAVELKDIINKLLNFENESVKINTIKLIRDTIKKEFEHISCWIQKIISLYETNREIGESRINGQINNLFVSTKENVVNSLIELLSQTNNRMRIRKAISILGDYGVHNNTTTKDLLCEYLKNGNEEIRTEAVKALGKIGHQKAIDLIIDLAENDPAEDVRIASIKAVSGSGVEKGFQMILKALDDKNETIRITAITTFSKYPNAKKEHQKLISILNNENEQDNIKLETIQSLGEIRACDSIPFMIEKLNEKESSEIQIACMKVIYRQM